MYCYPSSTANRRRRTDQSPKSEWLLAVSHWPAARFEGLRREATGQRLHRGGVACLRGFPATEGGLSLKGPRLRGSPRGDAHISRLRRGEAARRKKRLPFATTADGEFGRLGAVGVRYRHLPWVFPLRTLNLSFSWVDV